jgi:hypothetical protein
MGKILDEAKHVQKSIQPSGFHPMGSEAASAIGELLVKLAQQVESQQHELEMIRARVNEPAIISKRLPPVVEGSPPQSSAE